MTRSETVKILVNPGIALFVALVGWLLTDRYNATQIEVTKKRNDAEIEIARINASLDYLRILGDLPEEAVTARRQAIAISAPVLPPEMAFRLAIGELPQNTSALDTLMTKYEDFSNKYLVSALEISFPNLQQTTSSLSSALPSPRELEASNLLDYLRARLSAERLYHFILSNEYTNANFRATALLIYLHNYHEFLKSSVGQAVRDVYARNRIEREVMSLMSSGALSSEAKRSLALSAGVIFGRARWSRSIEFSESAAEHFWHGVDVANGSTPQEETLEGYVYEKVIDYGDQESEQLWAKHVTALASAGLRKEILKLDFRKLNIANVRTILYAYAQSGTIAGSTAYLMPADVAEVVRAVLKWADTSEKRRNLSMEFGSLGGDHLFRNLLPDCLGCPEKMSQETIVARCRVAREVGENLADWYGKHYEDDWYIPKFFYGVLVEFPDLSDKIDNRRWGFGGSGGSWEDEASRGCRGI